jgi:hypothetical protein
VQFGSKGPHTNDRLEYVISQFFVPNLFSIRLIACLNMSGNRGKIGLKSFENVIKWIEGEKLTCVKLKNFDFPLNVVLKRNFIRFGIE